MKTQLVNTTLHFETNHYNFDDITNITITYQSIPLHQEYFTECIQTVDTIGLKVDAKMIKFMFSDFKVYQINTVPGCSECKKYTEQGRLLKLEFSNKHVKLPLRFIAQGDTDQTGELVKFSVHPVVCQI